MDSGFLSTPFAPEDNISFNSWSVTDDAVNISTLCSRFASKSAVYIPPIMRVTMLHTGKATPVTAHACFAFLVHLTKSPVHGFGDDEAGYAIPGYIMLLELYFQRLLRF